MRVGLDIELIHEIRAEQLVANNAIGVLFEGPAILAHEPMGVGDINHVLQALEFAQDQRPVRPRAGIGHIEVIAAGLCLEAALAIRPG